MASEPSSVFSGRTSSDQNHDGTEFINNIGQSLSDSDTQSQLFQYCDMQRMKFLHSQCHKLNKIIQSANKIQNKLTSYLNKNLKTEKILVDFYLFACQIFKKIGLVKDTFDMSLSRISTVYKTVKKNYEKTQNSNKAIKILTDQAHKVKLQQKAQTLTFPTIPKILEMNQNRQPSIKDFNTTERQNSTQNAILNHNEVDFKEIQLRLLKRMEKYQEFEKTNVLLGSPKYQKKYNTTNSHNSDLKFDKKHQTIEQINIQRNATKQSFQNNTPQQSQKLQNSSVLSSQFDINLSEQFNEATIDEMIRKILFKKYSGKKYN